MSSNPPRQTRMASTADATTPVPNPSNAARSFMDRWIEPPLRAPAPSFMDEPQRGIERHGVLQTMSPLGTPPSVKIKRAIKTEEARKINLVFKGDASASTTPPPRQVTTPEPATNLSPGAVSGEAEDDDHDPKTPRAQTSPKPTMVTLNLQRHSLPPNHSPSISASPTKEQRRLLAMDRVVQSAVEEGLTQGRICTAYALRTLYNDHRSNPRITSLMDKVFRQRADDLQLREFESLMRFKKTEGRVGGKAKQWFDKNDNVFTPPHLFSSWSLQSSPAKRVAPDAASNHVQKSPRDEAGGHVSKKHKANSFHDHVHDRTARQTNGTSNGRTGHSSSRSRSRSHSTSSSLSSLDEELLNFSPAKAERSQAARKATSTSAIAQGGEAAANAARGSRNPPNAPQPIAPPSTPGPKLHAFPTTKPIIPTPASPSRSSAPPLANEPNASTPNTMPATYSEPAVFTQPQPSTHPTNLKLLKKSATNTPQPGDEGKEDRLRTLKRQARAVTERKAGIRNSFYRTPVETHVDVENVIESESDADSIAPTTRAKSGTILRFRSSQAARKANDESDDLSSPTLLSFSNEVAPGSSLNSRAGTPNALTRATRKPKGTGGGLRTKTSPMKKKTGPSAGLPRASGERNSPVGNGASSNSQDDNDDYCSACGGNGDLVCCDGCTRSFHFRCVDPPMVEGNLPDSWYCNVCKVSRNPRTNDDVSSFGSLVSQLEKKNPSAFHLPKDVREYFEGVRTGTEGEYEDGPVARPKRGAGYEEPPDYLRLKDVKGNFILCHECHRGAAGGKPIIPCSYCGLLWHLDCVDPPMANPPVVGKMWRCPCHVDDLLAKVPSTLGPAHRFRKIKTLHVIRPGFARGSRNMGHIEVEFDDSESDDESGFFERKEFGKIYKLPAKGIMLDFASRVRSQPPRLATEEFAFPESPLQEEPYHHTIDERQAAFNLECLATTGQSTNPVLGDPQLLIDALLAEAPKSVISLMARGDPVDLASGCGDRLRRPVNRQALLAMKAIIDASLSRIDVDEVEEKADEAVGPRTRSNGVSNENFKMENGNDDEDMLL